MSLTKKQKEVVAKIKKAAYGAKAAKKRVKRPVDKCGNGISVTTVLGEYGTRVEADREALNYLHPDVFTYQSAIFPNPNNFGVKVSVVKATVVNRDVTPSNRGTTTARLVPFAVELALVVSGPKDKANSCIAAFMVRSRPAVY